MKYIIYTRKSTEEDDRQVLSIEAQLVELKEFAAKEKLEIVASFQEAKTTKEPDKNIGSNHILQNRQLIFSPKIPYNLVAEQSEANQRNLTFPYWCPRRDSNTQISCSEDRRSIQLSYEGSSFAEATERLRPTTL